MTSVETGTDAFSDTAETDVETTPSFTVDKVVDTASIAAPTTLNYTITVTNTGNVTLNNVTPVDVLPDGSTGSLTGPATDSGVAGALDVGESWQYTVSFAAAQSDIDATTDLVNEVVVTTDETGSSSQTDNAVTTITLQPSMEIEKTVDLASINSPQLLSYNISLVNTGNVTLTNIVLVDTLPDGTAGSVTGPLNDVGVANGLDVGETWNFVATYNVSQAEIDNGTTRTNTIVATSDETGSQSFTDNALTTINRTPAFDLEKAVDKSSVSTPELLTYTITAVNTGNVSLSNITITDVLPDGSNAVLTGPLGDVGLAGVIDVGETWTWTGQYAATQADIDSGAALVNAVSVTTDEAGAADDTATTTVSQLPGIDIAKATSDTEFVTVGDIVNYSLVVTNTGNVALQNILVTDPGADPGSLVCPPSIPTVLLPGQQFNCTAQHTIVMADVLITKLDNQAFVDSEDPQGSNVSDQSEVITVPMKQLPPIATDNAFVSPVSAVPVTLPGAMDDSDPNGDLRPATLTLLHGGATDTDGDGDFDSLVVPGEGTWLVDNASGAVTFTPQAGFTGDPTPVPYTVADATALVSNEALLSIDYPQTAPVAKDDYKLNPAVESPSNPTVIDILADNGSGVDSDPENDIAVQTARFTHPDAVDTDGDSDADTLVVAGEGTWTIDNTTAFVTFVPEAGFLADPTPVGYIISDATGLDSNEAFITVDYPQTAPVAVDDQMLDQVLGQSVTIPTLANDTDPENNIDPTTVGMIDPINGNRVATVFVPGEGTWSADPLTGSITFTPEPGFRGDPTPIQYSVFDTTGLESNYAVETITYEEPATLVGTVWLDSDRDGVIDANEERKANWTLHIIDSDGNLVATTVTDANGDYLVTGLIPGEYTVEFYNEANVFMDSTTTNGPVLAGQTVNLPLPVDPSGVVYDSLSREPVPGATLNLVTAGGQMVDASCLATNQQGQVTQPDGLYAFDIFAGAHATCPATGIYLIELASVPEEYHPNFSSIIRQQGAGSCGGPLLGCAISGTFDSDSAEANCTVDALPGTSSCEVQAQPDAPQLAEDTRYYVEFEISAGDQNVIFNHLPIDAKANDAEILLSKRADKREVSVGGLVRYTLTMENTKDVPAFDVAVQDKPPAGFAFVPDTVQLVRVGTDGEFNTADDVSIPLQSTGLDPVDFDSLDLAALETARITYVMRVGTGVVPGEYTNRANATGPNGIASNDVSATVRIVADPVLNQATLIGKVFDDRDADGTQDPADATGVALRSDHYGWNSLKLKDLPGRQSVNDDPSEHQVTVNMPLGRNNRFQIVTREGTRITVDEDGTIEEAHVGAKARGLNGQDIRVCTQHTIASATPGNGVAAQEELVDVMQIVVSNYGIDERGIPGVRLATVTGLLIETDAYGRFNIPDVDAGSGGSGRNFVLKVDTATLPEGSSFTTENPYVLRIINNGLNRINFGVLTRSPEDLYASNPTPCADGETTQMQSVVVQLGSVFFDVDDHEVREDQKGIIRDIISKLREYGGGEILIEANTDSSASHEYNLALSERRADTIRQILQDSLGSSIMQSIVVQVDPDAYAKESK